MSQVTIVTNTNVKKKTSIDTIIYLFIYLVNQYLNSNYLKLKNL